MFVLRGEDLWVWVVIGSRGGGGVGEHSGHIGWCEGSNAKRKRGDEDVSRWGSSVGCKVLCLSCDEVDVVVSRWLKGN